MSYSNEGYLDITPNQADIIADSFISKCVDSGLYTGIKFYGNYDDTIIVVMKNNENFILMYSSSDENHFKKTDETISDILSTY